nr:PKD domain-containing protein [Pseudopedobacter sp.]
MKRPINYLCLLWVIFSFFLIDSQVFAQGSSNKGTDFWLGYGKHTSVGNMVLYITSDVNTKSTVTIPALNFSQTVDVVANTVVPVDIPTAAHLNVFGLSPNGIHVTSLKPIIVYAHIYDSSVSGATLVLPVNTLGKDYYSINYTQISNSKGAVSWFFVVAVEDKTTVEITPSGDTQNGWAANTTTQITLNKGEIYNVLGNYTDNGSNSSGVDLTGSRIKSISSNGTCKKIAVFSGSSKIAINCLNYNFIGANPGSADNLIQQAYPTATWGKNFITVPQMERNFVIYRILKSDVNAVVKRNGVVVNFTNNFYYDFASQQIDEISSDKPIQVVQYAVTQGKSISCNGISGDVGDPEMIYLNPLEQTLTQITMYSTGRFKILKHFINVVIKTDGVASFKLDGINTSSSFSPVPNNAAYSYAKISVQEGTHNLSSDVGFNAIAYGFGNAESYGYSAGANLTAFGVVPIDQVNNEVVQTGCVGNAYTLTVKLPYQPVDINLDKGDGNGSKPITLVLISKNTNVNGEITYTYLLAKDLIFTQPNTYNFTANVIKPTIDACGTGDEFSFDLIINPKPVSAFTAPAQSCVNSEVSFVHQTDPDEASVTNYLWDFNAEGISTSKDPKFTFTTPGIKKVKFSIKYNTGCWSDVVTKDVLVVALPVAKFTTALPSCQGIALQFADQSYTGNGVINKWNWDFGDPTSPSNSSTIQNPTHIFNTAKTYNVTLTITTDLGCSQTIVNPITIQPSPIPNFETPNVCLDDASAQFTNTTTISDNSNLTYKWNFGDPTSTTNTSALKNPSHKYLAAADYNVKLIVTSAVGCVAEITKVFTVNGSTPKSAFIAQNENILCSDQFVAFKDSSSIDFGQITRIDWYFDDATPTIVETDNQPAKRADIPKIYTHKYPTFFSPAQRKVIVKMTTYSGNSATCISTISKEIILKAVPKADFSIPNSCLPGGDAQFKNASTYLGGVSNMSYSWNFGDSTSTNNTATNQDPVHHYTVAGNYIITLIVTSANGCTAMVSKVFKVEGAIPVPNFSVSNELSLCSDQKVLFTDSTTLSFGELSKIEWYFDNESFPNNANYQLIDNSPLLRSATSKTYEFSYPTFNSPFTKNVNVKMKVFSVNGCESEYIKTIILKAVPNVIFNIIPQVCEEKPPYLITQAAEITGFSGSGNYSGKGISSSGLFSPFTAGVGTHPITYTFTGDNGCLNIKTQNITVNPTPTVDAGPDHTILIGGEVKLDAIASGKNVTYKWTPSGYLDHDDILNPIASPKEDTKYTLTVTSDDGCIIIDDVFIKVLKYPEIPNTFTPNGDGVNDTWSIKYLESYPSSTVKIFNRYGIDVFQADKYTQPWDGRLNGVDLPTGTYYYIITANNGSLKYTGSVLLVR